MAVRVTLECGHTSVLRSRTTPQGYTHDWEVFLRGVDNADVHQYIDKVVFILHSTFPKPKRVIKEPPYAVRESGYAGFVIPIHVYLKKKDEPKKIEIFYDLHLQPSGPAINKVIRHDQLFSNPPDEFRRKLLKGGATIVTSLESATDKGESQSTLPMIGKPKLSGTDAKKHRPPEPRTSNSFHDLFGEPIKTAKVSPENKRAPPVDKGMSVKPAATGDKQEKQDKMTKVKHSPHKDGKRERSGEEKKAEKKDKEHFRERERSKEKSKRPQSPAVKSSHLSPGIKRVSSPVPPKKISSPPLPPPSKRPLSPKPREKESKKPSHEREKERDKDKEKDSKAKVPSDTAMKGEKRKEKKKHKEDRDKDKKDKHKERDRDKSKENTKYNDKVEKPEVKQEKIERVEKVEKQVEKPDKLEREKIQETRTPKDVRKSPKPSKEVEKPKEEKAVKIEKPEKVEKIEKNKDGKGEREKQKHKHKKRDKKDRRDGSREREKKEKKDRSKTGAEKQNNVSIPPPATNPLSALLAEMPERDSSDSAPSPDDDTPVEPKQITVPKKSPPTPPPPADLPRPVSPPPPIIKKEKTEKIKKEKSKGSRGEEREGRKRKRRNSSKGEDEPPEKGPKRDSVKLEPVSSSQSPVATDTESMQPSKVKDEEDDDENTKDEDGDGDGDVDGDGDGEAEQVAPDSTNNTLAEVDAGDPPVFSEDYVSQLKDLQQKIMTLQDNQELQRVVQVIAETGQYEITKKTFDFDLCALDRRTVQRLQEFFSTS